MNITVNGIEYAPINKSDDIRIVILQRGWVFIGRYQETEKECILMSAKNYRYQGSKKGFGYVAENGPSKECILDSCSLPVRFNPLTVIATIDCNGEKWKSHLI